MNTDIIVAPFAFLFVFGVPAFVVWKYLNQKHQERMLSIEKGDPSLYKEMLTSKKRHDPLRMLKWGLLGLFVGGGLWTGIWMQQMHWYSEDINAACMLIGGGIALLLYYFIAMKMNKKGVSSDMP